MNKNDISLIISAPSGTGKTTIIKHLLSGSDLYSFSISTTTRQIRDGEVNGKNYYFVDVDAFNKMIQNSEFIEWASVHGNLYGTEKKEVSRIIEEGRVPIFDVDVQGAQNFKKIFTNGIFVFLLPPSMEELERRLRLRYTDTEEQIRIRLKNAIEEMASREMFDFILINENVDKVTEKIDSLVKSRIKS